MIEGVVVKISGDKTAQVITTNVFQHPLYGKTIRKEKKVACHFENIDLKEGDKVMIESCRPYSKTKKFIVKNKLSI